MRSKKGPDRVNQSKTYKAPPPNHPFQWTHPLHQLAWEQMLSAKTNTNTNTKENTNTNSLFNLFFSDLHQHPLDLDLEAKAADELHTTILTWSVQFPSIPFIAKSAYIELELSNFHWSVQFDNENPYIV